MRLLLLPFLLIIGSVGYAVEPTGRAEDDFVYAAQRCDLNRLKAMVDRGHDVNSPASGDRSTALIGSYACGFEQIRYLIEQGADVNATDYRGSNLTHRMAANCTSVIVRDLPQIFELLAAKQMNFNPTSSRETPVLLATRCAAGGNTLPAAKILNQLLKYGANVNIQDGYRKTPLHIALEQLNDELVRLLHSHGALLETKLSNGQTPLFLAAQDMESVLMALRKGLKPRFFTRFAYLINAGANIDAEDTAGNTPLFYAIREPIYYASERSTAEIDTFHKVRHLILLKANVKKLNLQGENLLHATLTYVYYPGSSSEQARRERNALPLIKLLRSEGVDPSQKSKQGESALDRAMRLRLNLVDNALRCTAC